MKSVSTFITFCVLLVVIILSVAQITPVAPQNTEGNFSADRAFTYVQKVAKMPHPTGSAAHDSVRNYIVSQARMMGYETQVQSARFTNYGQVPQISFLENILVRIKGKNSPANAIISDSVLADSTLNITDVANPKHTILVACHYDSRSNAAGAADDGAAVGAMLEILDMLKTKVTNEPFENDIIFLFSDGEEIDLLGAQAFMEQHPWAKEIGVAFNFEARGAGGMSILFETSEKNEKLLKQAQTALKVAQETGKLRAFGTSFANLVYQNMPNGTDAAVFGANNIPFINFAFIGNHTHYHTPLDTPENLDKRSLQQHGNYMLALIRHFGDLKNLKTQISSDENAIFLGVPGNLSKRILDGNVLILDIDDQYLQWTIYGMLIFFVLLFLSGLRYWSWKLLFGSLFGYLVIALTIGGLATLLWEGILMTHSVHSWMPYNTTYFAFWYQIAFALIFFGISLLVYSAFFRSKKSASVLMGVIPFWIGLSALSVFGQNWIGIDLRPTAYLFIIPTLSMLVAWLYLLIRNNAEYLNPFDAIILLVLSIPTIYIFYPVMAIVPEALEAVKVGGFIIYGFALMAVLIALVGLLLVPVMQLLTQGWHWSLSLFLMMVGIGILFWGALESPFTDKQPKPNSIFYIYNLDENKQTWASYDKETDEFTRQFLTDSAVFDSLPKGIFPRKTKSVIEKWVFLQESKIIELDSSLNFDAPVLSLVSDSMISETAYRYKIAIKPARNGEWIQLYSPNLEAVWNDTTRIPFMGIDKDFKTMSIWALPDSGAVVDIETSTPNPEFWISELKYGLNEVKPLLKTERQGNMMAAPYPYSESIIIQKKYTLIEENID
ncbi:M28 family peptidase [Bernardetia sp.]|uniref:M28 family peptidase n=1 Tax=Bernardetia sp. TaxID=1937974 RepID=UPI0025C6D244|nr:M28 family peptidase [Bernardetia sp.]